MTPDHMQARMRPAGIDQADADLAAETMQDQLVALLDLAMTLKHVHWNVIGPGFLAVHEMLDDHVSSVRAMADVLAERIATLGHVPNGLVGFVSGHRGHDDYGLGRATVDEHLIALDMVYSGVVGSHREAAVATEEPDPVTSDVLIGQIAQLEQLQWFVRAHIENRSGTLPATGTEVEVSHTDVGIATDRIPASLRSGEAG
jgi:starvation-inducible DNA-binding protein